jgi:NhaA family Na+:H+ antiporter
MTPSSTRIKPHSSAMRAFFQSQSAGGILLMGVAVLALLVANSPLASLYFELLQARVAGLSVLHWINDGLMAVFFLLVGLEIKREFLDGQLASWDKRILPGLGALGGVIAPACIYVLFNRGDAQALRGWAVPTATDIAFALGVLSLLGPRVPASLKVFLAALAIIDDLVAVLIIAIFYTAGISALYLGLAAAVLFALFVLNRMRVTRLTPYVLLGLALWYFVLRSGVHATLAGVALAMLVPMNLQRNQPEVQTSPLHQLEHAISPWSAFLVIPVFGFANAGISFAGMTLSTLTQPVTLGVALGLIFGKQLGVLAAVVLATRTGLARLPAGATWLQMYGVSLLCGIGFTMSLFIGLLAFETAAQQEATKLGVLLGSVTCGVVGWLLLRFGSVGRTGVIDGR